MENYLVFSNLRALCNEQAQMCYNNYILDVQQGVQRDPKKNFWRYVHSKTSNNEIPSSMRYNDLTADNGNDISKLFAAYFSTVYSVPSNTGNNLSMDTLVTNCSVINKYAY